MYESKCSKLLCLHRPVDPNGRCYNEVRLFFALDVTDPGYRIKKMLYGGSVDMDRKRGDGHRNYDYGSQQSDSSFDSNINVDGPSNRYNDDSNGHDNNKALGGREVRGRGGRLSMQHDDLTSKESLSLARFICAQVHVYVNIHTYIYTLV